MKKIIISLVVVALLLLGLPFVLGFEIESRYRGLIDRFEEAGYQLESHDYQRGFFSAEARTNMLLPVYDASGASSDLPFTLISHIQHGPYTPESGWFGELAMFDSEIEYQDKPLFPEQLQAQIQTHVAFAGDTRTSLNLPALEQPLQLQQEMTLTFSGMQGEVQFNAADGKLVVSLQSDGMQLAAGKGGRLEIGPLQFKSDSARSIEDMMLGTASFQVERIALRDDDKQTDLQFRNIEAAIHTQAVASNIDMRLRYSVGAMQLDDSRYGPAVIEIELTSLSAAALARIQQSMQEMQQSQVAPEQQGMAALGVVMSELPGVLEQNPGVAISRFELVTPQGKISMDLSLKADGMTLADVSTAPTILAKLDGKANMRIPESIVRLLLANNFRQQIVLALAQSEQEFDAESLERQVEKMVDAQLEAVLSQQFVERDGLDLVSVASLKAGLLSINGKSVPLPVMEN